MSQQPVTDMKGALIHNRTNVDLKVKLYPYRVLHGIWNRVFEIPRGEERYTCWKGSVNIVNKVQASRGNFWLDISYLGDDNKWIVFKENIQCATMVQVEVTGLSGANVTVTMMPRHLLDSRHLQLVASEARIIDELDEKANHFDTLGVSYDATENEIKAAFREKILRYHPDRFYNNDIDRIAATAITQRLVYAYHYLMDSERRKNHRLFVMKKMGIFSKGRWKAWKEAVVKDKKKFLAQALISTILIGCGITVTVLTAGAATLIVGLPGLAAAGLLFGAGANSAISLLDGEFTANGVDFYRYGKRLLAGAAAGALGGAITATFAAVTVTASFTWQLASASAGSSLDAVILSVSNGAIAGGYAGKSLQSVCLELVGTAVIGAAAGAAVQMVAPSVFANVADEAAAAPLAKLGPRAVDVAKAVVPKLAKDVVSGTSRLYRSAVAKALSQKPEGEDTVSNQPTTEDLAPVQYRIRRSVCCAELYVSQ